GLTEILVKQAKSKLLEAELGVKAEQERVRQHLALVDQQSEAVEGLKAKLKSQQTEIQNLEQLVKNRLKTQLDLQAAQELLPAMEHEIKIQESRYKQLKETDTAMLLQLAENKKDQAALQVALAEKQRDDFTVKAPTGGEILRINVNEGQA